MKEFYLKYLRPSVKHNPGFREVLIFLVFLVFYKISRFVAIGDAEMAFANAYQVVEFEKMLGIYWELPIQQYFLDKPNFIILLNEFYMRIHLPATILFFMWLFHKKREHYKFIRNGFLFANLITFFFYIYYPCAPPRMLNDLGFVDTLLSISNIDLYEGNYSKFFNQYAAIPSMHFGNALLIALTCFLLIKNKLLKAFFFIYPFLVLVDIVITGNHFFIDAIIGGIVVLLPFPFMKLGEKYFKKSTAPKATPTVLSTPPKKKPKVKGIEKVY